MAPPAKKRRTKNSQAVVAEPIEPHQNRQPEDSNTKAEEAPQSKISEQIDGTETISESKDQAAASGSSLTTNTTSTQDRIARFKALQARAKDSSKTNLKEATKESQRLATDPSQLTALHRKHAIASHKLLKADVEDAGEDFERKRAWDWTVDESEQWDKRMKKRESARDNNAFQDYTQEANKIYKRQLRNIDPDLDKYGKEKAAAIEKAAASGGLEIVETEDGELIAVDKDGSFYSTADSTTFTQNKPDKAAVDRLVNDLRRAEDQRLKKRRERMAQNGEDSDVTYINEKNKQFNQKLSRFYNKYTADIRDSFERGTMI